MAARALAAARAAVEVPSYGALKALASLIQVTGVVEIVIGIVGFVLIAGGGALQEQPRQVPAWGARWGAGLALSSFRGSSRGSSPWVLHSCFSAFAIWPSIRFTCAMPAALMALGVLEVSGSHAYANRPRAEANVASSLQEDALQGARERSRHGVGRNRQSRHCRGGERGEGWWRGWAEKVLPSRVKLCKVAQRGQRIVEIDLTDDYEDSHESPIAGFCWRESWS